MSMEKVQRTGPSYNQAFHVMVKPAGPNCNLRCGYCFYLEKHAIFGQQRFVLSGDVLEKFIAEYLRAQTVEEVTFAWQGGEPTLLGVDYFRNVCELQRKYADGHKVQNTLQTNGTLLDDEWCEFLAKEQFLVGLSLDGPRDIHDRYRFYADGRGSHEEVMRGLRLLKKHGVEFNALACVPRENAREGVRIYRFMREAGVRYIQFIPIIERKPDPRAQELGLDHGTPPSAENRGEPDVEPFTVDAAEYGAFLNAIYDDWIRRDVGRMFVNHFDIALNAWVGMPPPLCCNAKVCGSNVAMEHDGTVYTCDHYVYPEYALGNIAELTWEQIIHQPKQQEFGAAKFLDLPQYCRDCPWMFVCHGGCPKHRFIRTPDGEAGLNYLCEGFRAFYEHIDPTMRRMAELLRAKRSPAEIMREL
ncbi:anaerobic sulfatase maturase [Kiritimatiella glycovorans]|uniref:Anaerobic sulfatase-maturating enzyme n=1 Tax=Kiritimatiella glycovorans TaxID=1307763 RepID=A0A0G3EAJ0_9BACT|nr:anaerobic sulfatase maturase [Kiritimatiella glycovorans]AKJ63466.1 Anaerobic sulfatase-maturating enzyme [Kiritimatiella glycovorans]